MLDIPISFNGQNYILPTVAVVIIGFIIVVALLLTIISYLGEISSNK